MSQRGSIRQRGRTYTAYWFVRDEEGRRRQRSKGGFRTQGDAKRFLNDILGDVQRGTYMEPKKITLGAFVRDEWLPSLTLRENTIESYRDLMEGHVLPRLGGTLLPAITPKRVQRLYDELLTSGRRRGSGGLSPRTVQYTGVVLKAALDAAVRRGFIPRNPAAVVDRPRPRRREMQSWTAEETAAFLHHVRDDRQYALWLLAFARGMRRGELAGLKWPDVDLEGGRLAVVRERTVVRGQVVEGEPKTEPSRRTIPLDADLVSALRDHRRGQLEERMRWGEGWTDSGYLFTYEDGRPLHPERVSDAFWAHAEAAGLRRIRFHDARHTCATLALQAGVPTEVVSRWLGHASVSITQDVYQHAIPSLMEEAGGLLTGIVLSGRRAAPGEETR